MRGFYFLAALAAALLAPSVKAQEKVEKLDSIVVSASRAGKATPVTYTMVNRDDLRASSPLNSLPMTLNLQPSVVTSVEGGTGLGYSKLTIRGSKGSQINVTLNGITLNDAESQEVFWVNIPALTSLLSSVQVQRGLGTSANGAGAFGASINMSTASVGAEPTGRMELSDRTEPLSPPHRPVPDCFRADGTRRALIRAATQKATSAMQKRMSSRPWPWWGRCGRTIPSA